MNLESNDFYDMAEELLEYFAFLKTLENDYALSCEEDFAHKVAPLCEETKTFVLFCGTPEILSVDKETKQNFFDDATKLRGKILELLNEARQIVSGYVSFIPYAKVKNFDSVQRAFGAMSKLVSAQILLEKDENLSSEQSEVFTCRIDEDIFRKEFFSDDFFWSDTKANLV